MDDIQPGRRYIKPIIMDSMGIESLRFESKLKFVNEQAVNQVYLAFSVPAKTLLRPSEKSKKGKKIQHSAAPFRCI